MPTISYDPSETLRSARARYWEANGFGDDGGASKTWEIVKLGPIPIPILNIEARKKAIRFHDLHHVLTGYDTDFAGEAEVSAWELATGCSDKWVAWVLGFQILVLGLATPRRMLLAWARGRRTQSLYRESFDDALLDSTVEVQRTRLGLNAPLSTPDRGDLISLSACVLLSLTVQLGALIGGGLGIWWVARLVL